MRQRSGEGRVLRFVTFPSDARRCSSFYLDAGGLGGVFVPVGGGEDAERNRDFGVKIQIAWIRGVRSLECLSNRTAIRKEDKKRLLVALGGGKRAEGEDGRVASNTLLPLNDN